MKKALAIIFCMIITVNTFALGTGGGAAPFLRAGAGARAISLSGAFSANYDDSTVSYWNPAAACRIGRNGISSMYSWLSQDRTYNFLNGIMHFDIGTFGVSLINSSISGIQARKTDTEDYTEFANMENAYYLTYSKEILKGVSLGSNVKVVQVLLGEYSAFGMSLDMGFLITPMKEVSVGVMFQDIVNRLTWSTGYDEKIPFVMKIGLLINPLNDIIKLSIEGEQNEFEGTAIKSGLEAGFFRMLYLRGGISYGLKSYEFNYTFGAGIRYEISDILLQVDYAFLREEFFDVFEANHKLSINVYFK